MLSPDMHTIIERVPTIAEYRRLCEAVGMGRVVGDGAIFFYVQDVAVCPDHQGQGIGADVMSALVGWVRENAPDKAFAGLFAIKGTEPFYERFGFGVHDHDVGMFQVIRDQRTG